MTLLSDLEQATEGSRKLDAAIAVATGHKHMDVHGRTFLDAVAQHGPMKTASVIDSWHVPHYTTNLQDALLLVPEGYGWQLKYWANAERYQGWVQKMSYDGFDSEAKSAALALTTACLRAIEAEKERAA